MNSILNNRPSHRLKARTSTLAVRLCRQTLDFQIPSYSRKAMMKTQSNKVLVFREMMLIDLGLLLSHLLLRETSHRRLSTQIKRTKKQVERSLILKKLVYENRERPILIICKPSLLNSKIIENQNRFKMKLQVVDRQ